MSDKEPIKKTKLNAFQKAKNTLIDRVYYYRDIAFTKTGRRNKKMDAVRLHNQIIVEVRQMGHKFDGRTIRYTDKPSTNGKNLRRVGKTPIRYDYSKTDCVRDDDDVMALYQKLNEYGVTPFIKLGTLKPSEVKKGMDHIDQGRKTRITFEMFQGLSDIVKTDEITVKNGQGGIYYQELTLPLEEFLRQTQDETFSNRYSIQDPSCSTDDDYVPF